MSLQLNKKAILQYAVSGAVAFFAYQVCTALKPSPRPTVEKVLAEGGRALVLADGRIMEYFLFGATASEDRKQDRKVLLCLHGANTDGKLWELLDAWAIAHNIVILSPSLPGWGLSTANRGYLLADWVKDVQQLMAHLHVSSFNVMGASLGSAHAAAVASAYEPPDAVENVILYVAFAPEDKEKGHDPLKGSALKGFSKMGAYPRLLRLMNKFLVLPLMRLFLPKGNPVLRSFKWQWEGMMDANGLILQRWPFDWKNMAKRGGRDRKVTVVSGTKDSMCPPHNQKMLIASIAGSILIEYDGEHADGLQNPSLMTGHLERAL